MPSAVISELVTNAVAASAELRAAAPVLVWLGSDGYCLLLAVVDGAPAPITGLKKVVWAEWRLAEEEIVQGPPMPGHGRSHDVSGLTDAELERSRRDLQASLALARPGSTACVPMLAHLSAVETKLAERSCG